MQWLGSAGISYYINNYKYMINICTMKCRLDAVGISNMYHYYHSLSYHGREDAGRTSPQART
jgi:hypothetical protein